MSYNHICAGGFIPYEPTSKILAIHDRLHLRLGAAYLWTTFIMNVGSPRFIIYTVLKYPPWRRRAVRPKCRG